MAGERLEGVDLARALAVVGMVLVNFTLALSGELEGGLGRLASLPQGRASALFVVLAGVGLSLLAGDDPRARRGAVLRRALFLAVLGYLFALIWPADILHDYAAYFLVALTLYSAHVVLGIGPFESRLGEIETATAVTWWAVFSITAIGACHLWRRRFRRGPLEALMRRVVG